MTKQSELEDWANKASSNFAGHQIGFLRHRKGFTIDSATSAKVRNRIEKNFMAGSEQAADKLLQVMEKFCKALPIEGGMQWGRGTGNGGYRVGEVATANDLFEHIKKFCGR